MSEFYGTDEDSVEGISTVSYRYREDIALRDIAEYINATYEQH